MTTTAGSRGYASAREHFNDHSVRLLHFLKHYLLRYWHRLTDASGNLNDVFVSLQEALTTLGASTGGHASLPPAVQQDASGEALTTLRRQIDAWSTHVRNRALATTEVVLPLVKIQSLYQLTDVDVDLLMLLARVQSDLEFCRLCTFAWADFTRKQPDVSFLIDVLSVDPEMRRAATEAMSATGRLVRNHLVTLHDGGEWKPETPHFYRRALLPARILRFLLSDGEDEGRTSSWQHIQKAPDLESLCLDDWVIDASITGIERSRGRPESVTILALDGPQAVGKTTLAASLARAVDKRLLAISLEPLLGHDAPHVRHHIAEALREAILTDAVPLLDLGAGSSRPDETIENRIGTFIEAFDGFHGLVIVTATQPQPWLARVGDCIEVHVPYTSSQKQLRAWEQALSTIQVQGAIDARYLMNRFNLTAGQIFRAVEIAAGDSAGGARRGAKTLVEERTLLGAAKQQVVHHMGALAMPVSTGLDWEDLILPQESLNQLWEIHETIRNQAMVYGEWGFSRVVGDRRGLAVLFHGPPGTGKTMAACVLGKSLGRDVYRIDLSQIVDKYIGETEKNLARVFDRSERAQVMLLFDEADSLFAKRTEVQSSHDRYANLEVNFLLQRIETYEGLCVLTTNHEAAIDEAFKRRLRFRVQFPKPDNKARENLWRAVIPRQAQLAAKIDWAKLSRRFPLSGGHIRNAALRAAFLAAAEGTVITEEHLHRAASLESAEMGYLVQEG